jgi:hypothetical protein
MVYVSESEKDPRVSTAITIALTAVWATAAVFCLREALNEVQL